MVGLAKASENGFGWWWKMLMNKKNMILEVKHLFSSFSRCGVGSRK